MKIIANIIKYSAKIILLFYFRVNVCGKENFPENTNYIVAANHSSYIDPLLVGAFSPTLLRFIMLQSFYDHILLNWFCRIFRSIPVSQSGKDFSSIRSSLRALKKGDCLGIFPEGGRSFDGSVTTPMAGIGFLAQKAKVPIVPVGINGAFKAFPRGSFFPKPHKITLTVGAPVFIENSNNSPEELSQTVMAEIEKLSQTEN